MIEDVLAALPAEHRSRFRGFLNAPFEAPAALAQELTAYVTMLRNISVVVPAVRLPVVEKLGAVCSALLSDPELSGERAELANAAVRYFLRKEEDFDDTTMVLSFDDDVHVLHEVVRALGREDLVTALSARP